MNSKLAYIVPTHKKTKTLIGAIDSVLAQKESAHIIVVGPKAVLSSIDGPRTERIIPIHSKGKQTSYAELVNLGIEHARTLEDVEWVSILEHDDTTLPGATALFMEYRDVYDDVEMFAGLTLIVDHAENPADAPVLKTMANEACWAPNVMETSGLFDFNALLRLGFVFLNSTFIKLTVFDDVGMIKKNLKYYNDYEFTLRVVYNGKIVRGIPKATHYHFVNGQVHNEMNTGDKAEVEFWSNAARKEYFFDFDREVIYEQVEETEPTEA